MCVFVYIYKKHLTEHHTGCYEKKLTPSQPDSVQHYMLIYMHIYVCVYIHIHRVCIYVHIYILTQSPYIDHGERQTLWKVTQKTIFSDNKIAS